MNEIDKILEAQTNGKTIVATNGCFDILHAGHVKYLNESKKLGDILVVGLNSDQSVCKLKGPERPVNPEQDRKTVLEGLKAVDYVVIFDEDNASEFLKSVKANIYTKGADYNPEDLPEYPTCQELGSKIVLIDLVEGKSTTKLIEKIEKCKELKI